MPRSRFSLKAAAATAAAVLCVVVLASGVSATAAPEEGSLEMSQVNIVAKKGGEAALHLAEGSNRYSLAVNSKEGFVVRHNNLKCLSVDSEGNAQFHSDVLAVSSLSAENFVFNGVPQWSMVALEMFDKTLQSPTAAGWQSNVVAHCQGLSILLLGAPSEKPGPRTPPSKLGKVWQRLPKHDHVRVTATVHFIDDWQGETAYMKVDDRIVWTQGHDQRGAGRDVCGSRRFGESRFSVPVDVSFPHSGSTLGVELGATLEAYSQAVFGLSNIAVYLRTSN